MEHDGEMEATKCIYCKSQNSIFGMCKGYHFVCQECQSDFETCPTCFGEYLPLDDILMDTIVTPVNEKKAAAAKLNVKAAGKTVSLVDGEKNYSRKKKPIEQCRESFFLGVWDTVASSIFSPNKNLSFSQFLGQTCTKIAKRMGKACLNAASKKNNGSSIVPISIGLLCLLICSQLVFRKGHGSAGRVNVQAMATKVIPK